LSGFVSAATAGDRDWPDHQQSEPTDALAFPLAADIRHGRRPPKEALAWPERPKSKTSSLRVNTMLNGTVDGHKIGLYE
jgi:hypothetical protein